MVREHWHDWEYDPPNRRYICTLFGCTACVDEDSVPRDTADQLYASHPEYVSDREDPVYLMQRVAKHG